MEAALRRVVLDDAEAADAEGAEEKAPGDLGGVEVGFGGLVGRHVGSVAVYGLSGRKLFRRASTVAQRYVVAVHAM